MISSYIASYLHLLSFNVLQVHLRTRYLADQDFRHSQINKSDIMENLRCQFYFVASTCTRLYAATQNKVVTQPNPNLPWSRQGGGCAPDPRQGGVHFLLSLGPGELLSLILCKVAAAPMGLLRSEPPFAQEICISLRGALDCALKRLPSEVLQDFYAAFNQLSRITQ